jgi:hypothetical protein
MKMRERASLAHFLVELPFINDVPAFLSTDDENVIRATQNIRLLKKQFEGSEFKQAA